MSKKSPFKKIDFLPGWMKNPYVVCLVLFVIWMLFFDENTLAVQWRRRNELKSLNQKIDYYQSNIQLLKSELIELKTNDFTKEKFAREHYYMKRDNEEVFVFIDNQPAPAQPKHWWEKFF